MYIYIYFYIYPGTYIYAPGARRGDLLKRCLGLFRKGEFSSVVFPGERRWGTWKEQNGHNTNPPTSRAAADGAPSYHLVILPEAFYLFIYCQSS